jgi:hypothetical protein
MTRLPLLAIFALAFTATAPQGSAQRATPVAFSVAIPAHAALPLPQGIEAQGDTTKTRSPRAFPFIIGGAVIGGVVGAVLATSYNFCDSDPSQGVYCSSTDPATGAIIGMAIGAAAGGLLWALIRYSREAPPATSSSRTAR